eukprot:TRINITY_DN23272_c0_g1_i3.p2 TRINITY_DN23272_c0_g1~~TRINITY_DN23272_c0_g1_i3.p2  ORF type:complete len:233 (+),score=65.33 TRINITY_DN23272_c0_g1_i3:125-823(+)
MLLSMPAVQGSQAAAAAGKTTPKRQRPNGAAAGSDDESLMGVAEASATGSMKSVLNRIAKLEKLAIVHDDILRSLEGKSMSVWLLSKDDELARMLLGELKKYNEAKPKQGGAHPWGPARRPMALALVNHLLQDTKTFPEGHTFRVFHSGLSDVKDLDKRSLNHLQIKETRDDHVLLKLRPYDAVIQLWADAIKAIDIHVEANHGEKKFDAPPPGPIVREIRARDRRTGKDKA